MAIICIYAYSERDIFRDKDKAALNYWAVAGLVFWTLFPPTWFFTNFHAVVCGALEAPAQSTDVFVKDNAQGNLVQEIRAYADFSSKIWAAFLVLYGVVVSYRVKAREEEIKTRKENEKAEKEKAKEDELRKQATQTSPSPPPKTT